MEDQPEETMAALTRAARVVSDGPGMREPYSTSWRRVITVFSSGRAGTVPAALKIW